MIAGLQQNSHRCLAEAWTSPAHVSGRLKKKGTEMNAAKRIIGVVSIAFVTGLGAAHADINKSAAKLTLDWAPGARGIIGYDVYYGRTSNPAKMQVLPQTPGLDLRSPAVELDVLRDLGALPGQQVCFRIRAYNRVAQSPLSPAMCSII